MDVRDAEEFTASLEQIVEGGWRQVALGVKIGIPQDLGLTRGDWCGRVTRGAMLRGAERQEAVLELKADKFSNRAIADVLGVDAETVNRDTRAANAASGGVAPEEDQSETAANTADEFFSSEDDEWQENAPTDSTPSDPEEPAKPTEAQLETKRRENFLRYLSFAYVHVMMWDSEGFVAKAATYLADAQFNSELRSVAKSHGYKNVDPSAFKRCADAFAEALATIGRVRK